MEISSPTMSPVAAVPLLRAAYATTTNAGRSRWQIVSVVSKTVVSLVCWKLISALDANQSKMPGIYALILKPLPCAQDVPGFD